MKETSSSLILFLALLFSIPNTSIAQGESAVPFLLIAPNPAANGWGGVSTCVVSDNPIATVVNPGQLGLFSLNNYFSASTYVPETQWLPPFAQSDLTYNVSAVSAGVNLSHAFDLQLPLSIGVEYSRVYLDLGSFTRTGSGGPEPIGTFEAWEKSESFSVGMGIDYFVRLGIGMSFESIVSSLSPIGTEQEQGTGKAEASATDFGALLEVPIIDIIGEAQSERVSLGHNLSPLVNLSAGYVHQNHGGEVIYIEAAQSDPLPRNVIIGLGVELGLEMNVRGQPWKLMTFTLAHEAEDLLIVRTPAVLSPDSTSIISPSTFEYQSGLGDISFFKHVIQGKLDDDERPNLHKGWQLNFGELVYVRGGSFAESPNYGNRNYTTNGFGVRLGGIFKLMYAIEPEAQLGDVLSFIANHLDVTYDHAEYANHEKLGGTKFNALGIILR